MTFRARLLSLGTVIVLIAFTATPVAALRITGTDRADVLEGTAGPDVIRGLEGNDTITGEFGKDRVYGGLGNDRIGGDGSVDQVYGGRGHDELFSGGGADWLYGGPGNDTIHVNDGWTDTVRCGSGDDRVFARVNDIVYDDCETVIMF